MNSHSSLPTGALVQACFRGDIDSVTKLLQAGANPNTPAPLQLDGVVTDTAPLLASAAYGAAGSHANSQRQAISSVMIRKLLEAGASVRSVESQLLESLTIGGNAEALQIVLKAGARPRQAFQIAALAIAHHQISVLVSLRGFGVDPNITDGHGNTVLHHICSGSIPFFRDSSWHSGADPEQWHLERVRELVASGVDLDRRDAIGTTGLMRAIVARQMPLARALIEAGADINCRMRNGVAALHLAVARSNQAFVGMLLEKNIDRQDLLRMAMKRVQPDIRSLLGTKIRSSELRKTPRPSTDTYEGPERRKLSGTDARGGADVHAIR